MNNSPPRTFRYDNSMLSTTAVAGHAGPDTLNTTDADVGADTLAATNF